MWISGLELLLTSKVDCPSTSEVFNSTTVRTLPNFLFTSYLFIISVLLKTDISSQKNNFKYFIQYLFTSNFFSLYNTVLHSLCVCFFSYLIKLIDWNFWGITINVCDRLIWPNVLDFLFILNDLKVITLWSVSSRRQVITLFKTCWPLNLSCCETFSEMQERFFLALSSM